MIAGMRHFLLLCTVSLCTVALVACAPNTSGSSGDSPAERLYAQAANTLSENYNGYSQLDLPATLEKYRAQVAKACAGAKDCKFEIARTALDNLLEEIDDGHSFYETPEAFAASQRTQNGLGAATPRLGVNWVYREASNAWLIVDTTAGLPAQAAGLSRGDLVTALNGAVLPKGLQASNALLSTTIRSGQTFSLTVKRAGVAREVSVQGKLVNVAPLPYQRRPTGLPSGTVLIRIPDFSPPTGRQGLPQARCWQPERERGDR
jgi:carboxyl-terminal processing protease